MLAALNHVLYFDYLFLILVRPLSTSSSVTGEQGAESSVVSRQLKAREQRSKGQEQGAEAIET